MDVSSQVSNREELPIAVFGILSDIDVQHPFAETLDAEFRQSRILGTGNPPLAKQALEEELQLGALLPCNVVGCETGGVGVRAVDPHEMFSVVDNPALDEIADDVGERFDRVLEEVAED